MLEGKNVLLGVSGSIAAYLSCDLARRLIKAGARVQAVMTAGAAEFITPLTLQTLTGRPVIRGLFDEIKQWNVEHVGAAQWADVFVAAPATANVLAKLALGLADDSLSAAFLACDQPKVLAPAMNTRMYENPATQANLRTLKERGCLIVEPQSGLLACGDVGQGKLAELTHILQAVEYALEKDKPLKGVSLLVTAGPTCEDIDPVRFITNRSSGRMGYAIAREAWIAGAEVTLVSGPVRLEPPYGCQTVNVRSAADMARAVLAHSPKADIVVKAAAVADYTPKEKARQKLKKGEEDLNLALERTTDILAALGRDKRPGQVLVGFAAETGDLAEKARGKLNRKNADLLAANDLTDEGAGFGVTTNRLLLLWPDGRQERLALMTKEAAARRLLEEALAIWWHKNTPA